MRVPDIAAAALVAFTAAGLATQAVAQETERFRLERTENGYVRMDTRTGAMSLCRERSGELVCSTATDEGQIAEAEGDDLRDRLSALEERVEALEEEAGGAADLPTEDEFEQTLGLMERFFRRFMDIVKGLEEDLNQNGEGQTNPPERT